MARNLLSVSQRGALEMMLDKSVTTQRNSNLAFRRRQAEKLFRNGLCDESLSICNEILITFPKNLSIQKLKKKILKQQHKNLAKTPGSQPIDLNINTTKLLESEDIVISLIETDPENKNLWILLGEIYRHSDKISYAMQCFNKALEISKNDPDIIYEIGKTFTKVNDLGNAYKSFQLALSFRPNDSMIFYEIGLIYDKIRKFNKAKEAFLKSIELDQNNHFSHTLLGIYAMQVDGNAKEALKHFKHALQVAPNEINMYNNVVCAYLDLGEHEKVLQLFKQLELNNDIPLTEETKKHLNFQHGLALIGLGEIDKGRKLYQDRIYMQGVVHTDVNSIPCNRLENKSDAFKKKILVLREQGVGDQIYLLGLLKKFAHDTECEIVLDVEPRLLSLMQRSFPDFKILDYDVSDDVGADFWIAYADLAYFQKLSKTTRNISGPYIKVNDDLFNFWNDTLPNPGLRVGLAWRSGNMDPKRVKNYTELSDWSNILRKENVCFVCLQYEYDENEINDLPENIRNRLYVPNFNLKDDFDNLAAVMKNCDLVIGPSSAPVHQASAIGTNTIVYTLKGKNAYSCGLWLEHNEYQDISYSNCKNITFDQYNRATLVKRVDELIDMNFK